MSKYLFLITIITGLMISHLNANDFSNKEIKEQLNRIEMKLDSLMNKDNKSTKNDKSFLDSIKEKISSKETESNQEHVTVKNENEKGFLDTIKEKTSNGFNWAKEKIIEKNAENAANK